MMPLRWIGHPGVHHYRLPIEAEWEYAARGGLIIRCIPGEDITHAIRRVVSLPISKPLRGNYADDGGVVTVPVGTYSPNDFDLYDMAGNVAEWTSSAYDESAYMFRMTLIRLPVRC